MFNKKHRRETQYYYCSTSYNWQVNMWVNYINNSKVLDNDKNHFRELRQKGEDESVLRLENIRHETGSDRSWTWIGSIHGFNWIESGNGRVSDSGSDVNW